MTMVPVMVTAIVVMMPQRNMESKSRTRMVNNRWRVNHGRRLINDSGLLHDHRLRVNNSGLRLHHDLSHGLVHHDRCGLRDDDRCRRRIYVNGRSDINRPRFERFCQQKACSHTCDNNPGSRAPIVAGFHSRNRTPENSQCCCHY